MLSLIFAIVIGRAFYQLAEEHKKSKWGYAIFGVILFNVCFYVYFFMAAILIDKDSLEYASSDMTYFLVVILPYIVALIVSVVLYILFDKKWKKTSGKTEVDNIGEN